MDIDLALKAVHVAAALTFAGGLLAASLAVAGYAPSRGSHQLPEIPTMLKLVRRWDQRVTTPALLIVWAAGLALAIRGSWFASPWLMIKLAVVLFLTALHGVLSGMLRGLEQNSRRRPPSLLCYAAPAVVVCLSLISILVVTKLF